VISGRTDAAVLYEYGCETISETRIAPRSRLASISFSTVAFWKYSREVFSLVTLELWHRMFLDGEQVTLR